MTEELGSWRPSEEGGEVLASTPSEREGLLRRHPWWAAAVVLLVVVGVGAGTYLAQRPPAESTSVDLQVESLGGQGQYTVVLRTPGEQVKPVGIVGPGLMTPTSTIDRVTSTGPGIGNLGATIDCSGEWWTARPADYLVRVERTDAYGRVRTFEVPPEGVEYWWDRVQAECLARSVFALGPVTATTGPAPGRPGVDVTLHVENPNPFDIPLWLTSVDEGFVSWPDQQLLLPAGGTVDVRVPMRVDCTGGRPQLSTHTYATVDGEYNGPSIQVTALLGRDAALVGPSLLRLDRASAQDIDDALEAACP